MAEETFEQRLQAFYDKGTEEDRELIRFMCAATLTMVQQRQTADVEGFQFSVAPGGSGPGPGMPSFGAVELNPTTERQNAALRNMLKKWSDTSQSITQNLK